MRATPSAFTMAGVNTSTGLYPLRTTAHHLGEYIFMAVLHLATSIIWKQAMTLAVSFVVDGLTCCDSHHMAASNVFPFSYFRWTATIYFISI